MAAFVLINAKIMHDGRDLSGILNQITLNSEAELAESTAFGDTFRKRLAGLFDTSMDMQGWWDSVSATDSADADLFSKLGGVKRLISLSGEGGTVGDIGYSFEADEVNYNPGAALGEVFAFNLTAQGSSRLLRGQVLENATRTVTANGTAKQIGSVSATQSVYSALHVTAVSGTLPTLDVTVESDDAEGFATAVTRITHAQKTAVGSELLSAAGAITDDWWRLRMVIGGTAPSFTIFGVVAIANT